MKLDSLVIAHQPRRGEYAVSYTHLGKDRSGGGAPAQHGARRGQDCGAGQGESGRRGHAPPLTYQP